MSIVAWLKGLTRRRLDLDARPPSRHRAQRWSLATRLRRRSRHRRQDGGDQQPAADGRRCGRSSVPRHDRGLRRRRVHSGDDGAAARFQFWKPADHAVRHPCRPPRRALLSAGPPAAGHDPRERRCPDRRDLGHARAGSAAHRCRRAAEGRAVLADTERCPRHHVAGPDRPDRDGSAGPADCVREHRGARPGARAVAARRDRRAPGAWRDAGADRPPAGCREPRPRRARCPARRPPRAERDPGARRVRRAARGP